MSDTDTKPKHPHDGHRGRLRERFSIAPHSLTDHELLELLLFYSIPRRNTNEIAHGLLDHFKSIENVVNADMRELCDVEGMGEGSAYMMRVIREMLCRIARQHCALPESYDRTQEIITYIQHLFVGETTEKLYLLLFDNGLKTLDCVCLDEGAVNRVPVSPRTIVDHVVRRQASAIILAHNHPGGVAVPSADDIQATKHLKTALASLHVDLLEHFVIADDRYVPILSSAEHEPEVVEDSFFSAYLAKHDDADRQ